MEKPLYRSANDRWLAGVCGGIAEYTGIPAILVRLLFVALCLLAIPFSVVIGILVYIAALFLLPETPGRKTIRDPGVIDAEFEVKE